MTGGATDTWGIQREICLRADPDEEGNPRRPPFRPVMAAFRIDGEMRGAPLLTAISLVAEQTDVLHARLRRSAGRFVHLPEAGATGMPIVTVDLTGSPPPDQWRRLRHLAGTLRAGLNDMQDGPLGTMLVARTGEHERVLCGIFDHSTMDLHGISSWMRRLGQVYGRLEAGDAPGAEAAARPGIGFLPYVREQVANVGERDRAKRFWGSAARAGVPIEMPGCRWRPWQEIRATVNHVHEFPAADIRAFAGVCQVTGGSRPLVFLAALTLVIAGSADIGFAPITYVRHGRPTTGPAPVGPLLESVVTCGPRPPAGPVASWMADFCAVNAAAPSLRGWALADFGGLDTSMELRRFMFNAPFPRGKLRFGTLRGVPVALNTALPGESRPIKHCTGIRLFAGSWERMYATIHHDPSDLPDGIALLDAAGAVLRRVAERPETAVPDVMAMAAGQMAAGSSRRTIPPGRTRPPRRSGFRA